MLILFIILLSMPTATAEFDYGEVETIVYSAAKEIKPDLDSGIDSGIWIVDNNSFGQVCFWETRADPEMQRIEYWDINKRLICVEHLDGEIISDIIVSGIMVEAPLPNGGYIMVKIQGYNLPLSDIRPVAEHIFFKLVEQSIASGAIEGGTIDAEETPSSYLSEETPAPTDDVNTDSTISDSEAIIDIPPTPEQSEEIEEYESSEYINYDDEFDRMNELQHKFEILEEEGEIYFEEEVDIEEIDKQDIEEYQNIMMNHVLPYAFIVTMEYQAKVIDLMREESSEDIDKLDEMEMGVEQDIELNKEKMKAAFNDDFTFEAGKPVGLGHEPRYIGEEKVGTKLNDTMNLGKIDTNIKETIKKLKTGHEAASFLSDDYANSKISKNFEKIDKLNSVKETVDKCIGSYNDLDKLSDMKGASGTTAKAVYVVVKGGQEVADKIPVVGGLIKNGLEITEKMVMAVSDLDSAIKNGDLRQGRITNGVIGTSTPNAFLSKHGKVTQTEDGPSYSMPYTDDKGKKHEISPDMWIKITVKGQTYYVPTDEDENPIGDIAIKDAGSSWKPWKWDNCMLVKRTDPKILYNNGEEFDL